MRVDRSSAQTLAATVRWLAMTALRKPTRAFIEDTVPPLPCQQLDFHEPCAGVDRTVMQTLFATAHMSATVYGYRKALYGYAQARAK